MIVTININVLTLCFLESTVIVIFFTFLIALRRVNVTDRNCFGGKTGSLLLLTRGYVTGRTYCDDIQRVTGTICLGRKEQSMYIYSE